jgi:5-methylcytosine-specific restriction endonuclease McrA
MTVETWNATPDRVAELRRMPYEQYLKTPEWQYRRHQMICFRERKCERCRRFSVQLHVHHRSYKRLGNEDPDDLEVLCEDCHREEHGL